MLAPRRFGSSWAAVVNLTYGGRWRGVSAQDPLQVSQASPATAPSPPDTPPPSSLPSHAHPPVCQAQIWQPAARCAMMDGARTFPPQPHTLGRPLRTVGPQKRRKYARVCVCPVCIISVSENSKSSIVRDSDESSTSVPPFHIIYTIGTQKTERGGHQGRQEARKSKAAPSRNCLVSWFVSSLAKQRYGNVMTRYDRRYGANGEDTASKLEHALLV